MTRRLYVSDLDGTLLDPDARLSPVTRAGLLRVLEAGVPFTVATARSPASIRIILGDLPLALPVVALHGALLHDLASGRHLRIRAIRRSAAEAILDVARAHGTSVWVSTHDGTRDLLSYDRCTNDGMRWYLEDRVRHRDPRLRRVDDVAAAFDDPTVCVTVMADRDTTRAVARDVAARTGDAVTLHVYENAYSPGWHWMTAHPHDAGKDVGVRDLVEHAALGDHEIVAFGDTTGDLPLFAAAHRRIAVANAEAPLLAAACETIGHHATDSVVRYVLRDAGLAD